MKKSDFSRPLSIAAFAAIALGAFTGSALAQARTSPHMADCLSPQNALQKQQCDSQRQPFYTSDGVNSGPSGPMELRDQRPVMSLDNGGGGSQAPVVPNTTGAPATSGATPTWN
jgi:hypothetical protein